MDEEKAIVSVLKDDELLTSLPELLRMSKGLIPKNVILLTEELIKRFERKLSC